MRTGSCDWECPPGPCPTGICQCGLPPRQAWRAAKELLHACCTRLLPRRWVLWRFKRPARHAPRRCCPRMGPPPPPGGFARFGASLATSNAGTDADAEWRWIWRGAGALCRGEEGACESEEAYCDRPENTAECRRGCFEVRGRALTIIFDKNREPSEQIGSGVPLVKQPLIVLIDDLGKAVIPPSIYSPWNDNEKLGEIVEVSISRIDLPNPSVDRMLGGEPNAVRCPQGTFSTKADPCFELDQPLDARFTSGLLSPLYLFVGRLLLAGSQAPSQAQASRPRNARSTPR